MVLRNQLDSQVLKPVVAVDAQNMAVQRMGVAWVRQAGRSPSMQLQVCSDSWFRGSAIRCSALFSSNGCGMEMIEPALFGF